MPDALFAHFRSLLPYFSRMRNGASGALTRQPGSFAAAKSSFASAKSSFAAAKGGIACSTLLTAVGLLSGFSGRPGTISPANPAAPPYKVHTVVIDAGHGGKDRGCNGKTAYEADVALKLALALGRRIEDSMPGVDVIYTRKTDVFIELIERAEIANRAAADVFISIHLNSGPAAARGTEIWVMGTAKSTANLAVAKRENAVVLQETNYKKNYGGFDPHSPQSHILFSLFQSAYRDNSLRFAQAADKQLRAAARPSRGVKEAGFIVLWKTAMPSVLIEAGFLTNPQDEKLLNTSAGQTYTALALFRAFKNYKQQLEALD